MVSKGQSGTRGYEIGGYIWWTGLTGGGVGWDGSGESNTPVVPVVQPFTLNYRSPNPRLGRVHHRRSDWQLGL